MCVLPCMYQTFLHSNQPVRLRLCEAERMAASVRLRGSARVCEVVCVCVAVVVLSATLSCGDKRTGVTTVRLIKESTHHYTAILTASNPPLHTHTHKA